MSSQKLVIPAVFHKFGVIARKKMLSSEEDVSQKKKKVQKKTWNNLLDVHATAGPSQLNRLM